MRKYALALLLTIGTLVSCAPSVHSSVSQLNPTVASRASSATVEVFTDRANVPAPYTEIALIIVDDGGSSAIGEDELISKIVEEAKTLGADGVLITNRTTQPNGGVLVYNTYVQASKRTYQAIAFAYK